MKAQDMLTWLNGRAGTITIFHEGIQLLLWYPELGISIEDAIVAFVEKNGIKWEKEIEG